jgi:hypothetical protein
MERMRFGLFLAIGIPMMVDAQNLSWYHTWEYYWEGIIAQYLHNGPIAVDAEGNTYMASTLLGTIDVDPGPGTTVLSSGVVNGSSHPSSICLSKFDAAGDWAWTRQVGYGPANNAQAVAVDPAGNVYVSGRFTGTVDFDPGPAVANLTSAGEDDIFVMKFDPDGGYLWARRFGSAHDIEGGWDLAVDAAGNAHVMVSAFGTFDVDPGPGVVNFTPSAQLSSIIKLDTDGGLVWARTLQLAGTFAAFYAIDLDADGNIAIIGRYSGAVDGDPGPGLLLLPTDSTGAYDTFIMKWDADGNGLWARGLAGVDPRDVAADDNGQVIAVGGLLGAADLDPGPGVHMHNDGGAYVTGWILKLDEAGEYVWSKVWTTSSITQVDHVAADHNGNVILSGIYDEDMDLAPGPLVVPAPHVSSGRCGFITALDANGAYVWSGELGQGQHDAYLDHMALAPDNTIRLSGWFHGYMDMDPGTGSTVYTGSIAAQSTMLMAINNTAGITAVPDIEESVLALHPNPTSGPLTVTAQDRIEHIRVFDGRGALVAHVDPRAPQATLDLASLAAGSYTVELRSAAGIQRRKFVKY